MMRKHRGIVIGPLLMAIALIAVVVGALAYGNSTGNSSLSIDRISSELRSQVDLIRGKIGECVYLTRQVAAPQYAYPADSALDTPVLVSALTCPRDAAAVNSLWEGRRPTSLPEPPKGFEPWYYVNHGDPASVNPGGTCIRIQPTAALAADATLRDGIAHALRNFAPTEYTYDENDSDQVIIFWIRKPQTGEAC